MKYALQRKLHIWGELAVKCVYIRTIALDVVALLDVVGRCWMLLDVVGCCWTLLDVVGRCWMLLDAVGCCWMLLDVVW